MNLSLDEVDHILKALNTMSSYDAVSYTHLRAHETCADLVCRLLLEKKNRIHSIYILHFAQSSAA